MDKKYFVPTNLIKESFWINSQAKEELNFRKVLESKDFKTCKEKFPYIRGKDENGEVVLGDLEKENGMLVTGSVGQGKTNFFYNIILSLTYKFSPYEAMFFLIDPIGFAFEDFKKLPHLYKWNIFRGSHCGLDICFSGLELAIEKGFLRRSICCDNHCKTITELINKKSASREFPPIFVIVDEIADLMLVDKERTIKYLLALLKLQDYGIYTVIGTKVINETILPQELLNKIKTKISFRLGSSEASELILNESGAEDLEKAGIMLFKTENQKPIKYITPFIFTGDAKRVSEYLKKNTNYVC